MKKLILSWTKVDGKWPGNVMINNLKIVPEYKKTASPVGVFLTLLEVLKYLGFEMDGEIINKYSEKPEQGQFIRLRQK
jgi:hypothetical protein